MEQTFGRWLRGDPPPLLPRVASAQLLPRVPSTTKLSTSGARGTSTRSRWWGGSAGAARILAAAVAIFLSVHIAALLLGSQPVVPATPATWTDLQLDGDSMAAGGYDIPGPPTTPRLMPRIIHQLFNGSLERPEGAADAYRAWRQVNPGWELRFYDLNERAAYVRRWFPEYVGAYDALSSDAERKDLFRYLALLRHGGVFADGLGTETPPQLEDVLTATDTLVVGWDQEFPSAKAAIDSW